MDAQINTGSDLGSIASGISDPGTKSLFQKMDANDKEEKEFSRKTIDKMEDEPKPKPPTITPAPELKDYQRDPMQSFGSAAGFLATFGSLLTRRPLTSALNAGAAVMTAANQKDAAAFSSAFDKWKVETENAWKMTEWDMNQYKDLLGKDESEARIHAASTKNDTALAAIQAKMSEQYHRDMMKQFDQSKKPVEAVFNYVQDGLAEEDAKRKAQGLTEMTQPERDKKKLELFSEGQNAIKQKGILTDDDYNQKYKDDESVKSLATSYHSGALLTQLAPGLRSDNPRRDAIVRKSHEMYGDFDWAEQHVKYVAEQSGARSLAIQTKKIELASNMLDTSLPSMMQIADKVGLGRSTDLNALYNAAKRHLSDKDFSNFSTQLRAVTSDYAQFIGRGRMTVHSDQEALRILNEDMGITSLQGFVDAVNIERQNVDSAIKKTETGASGEEKPVQLKKTVGNKTYIQDENGDWYEGH